MNYVIPVKDKNQACEVLRTLTILGYKQDSKWNLNMLVNGDVDCVYALEDGVSEAHFHAGMYTGAHKLVKVEDVGSTIKPFQDSYDVGNT